MKAELVNEKIEGVKATFASIPADKRIAAQIKALDEDVRTGLAVSTIGTAIANMLDGFNEDTDSAIKALAFGLAIVIADKGLCPDCVAGAIADILDGLSECEADDDDCA